MCISDPRGQNITKAQFYRHYNQRQLPRPEKVLYVVCSAEYFTNSASSHLGMSQPHIPLGF